MTNAILGTLGVMCILGGIVATFSLLYYFFYLLGSVKPEKKRLLNFLGPLMLIYPDLFDEAGRRARLRLLVSAAAFAACLAGAAIISHVRG
jgi:hypothetical protein